MTAKSSPSSDTTISKGESPFVGSFNLKIASGFLKISLGPTNPAIALLMQPIAASVLIAADAPLESDNYLPALMALNGIKWAQNIPIADSICSAVAPKSAP